MGIVVVAAFGASAEGPSAATTRSTRPATQFGRQDRQVIVLTLCPTVFDRNVLAFDKAGFGQSLAERGQQRPTVRERRAAEESDHRHRRLLRARRTRPKQQKRRRAAEER